MQIRALSSTYFSLKLGLAYCLTLLMPAVVPLQAGGASLAEEHTVIYYLIEMQRQYTKSCNGTPMAASPSLTPSESLRNLATEISMSGQPAQGVLSSHGLQGAQVFYATVPGGTAKQVVDNLVAQSCSSLMGPALRYIGAAQDKGIWLVLMADREPVFPGAGAGAQQPENLSPELHEGTSPQEGGHTPQTAQQAPRPGVTPLHEELPPQPVFVPQPIQTAAPEQVQGAPLQAPPLAGGPEDPAPPQVIAEYGYDQSRSTSIPPKSQSSGVTSSTPSTSAPGADARYGANGQANHAPQAVQGSGSRYQSAPVRLAAPHSDAPQQQVLLYQVNQTRAQGHQCGGAYMPPAPALVENSLLTIAAEQHTADMIAKGYFSSASPAGVTLGQRVSKAGYAWGKIAEVISSARPPASMALETWLYQESQCKMLMSPAYTEAGIAFDPHKNYWVLTLAAPMQLEEGSIRLE